ncbi:MAG: type II secretion system protein N [Tepidimonas ignava]|uniref:type II secretion system protein N n=1 Tax=Tepidimonas ignava TaxID=114249 RepID=UPI002FDAF245
MTTPVVPVLIRHRLPAAGVRLGTLLAWTLAGWVIAAVGWRVWGQMPPPGVPSSSAPPNPTAAADVQRMARALGADAARQVQATPATAESSVERAGNWRVVGVVADGRGQGAALLVRDEGTPRPYRVGAPLPSGGRVLRVERDAVWLELGDGGPAMRLTLPPRTAPSR